MESFHRVKYQAVRRHSDHRAWTTLCEWAAVQVTIPTSSGPTVLIQAGVCGKMEALSQGVVAHEAISKLGQKWTRVLPQRVEQQLASQS